MALTIRQFIHDLLDSGLITAGDAADVRALVHSGRKTFTVESLAEELVQQKKLTSYQAERILAGTAKGLVLGNYVVLEKIGQGGMGHVYKAQHRRMKRVVALKVLSPTEHDAQVALKRFQREVEAAAKLVHPNIVTAYDADESDGHCFLVIEFVDGPDLATLVERNGPFSVALAVDCIMQAARGLAYAHSLGIVHRDIKPQNLLLDSSGTVKILDMGLARFVGVGPEDGAVSLESLTQCNEIVGTVDYMSPEQVNGAKNLDHRTDIYSLGGTLFRLLTGRPPYRGETTFEKLLAHVKADIPSLVMERSDVPAQLELAFRRMMAKDPAVRFSSMNEVIAELSLCRVEPPNAAPARETTAHGGKGPVALTQRLSRSAQTTETVPTLPVTPAQEGTDNHQVQRETVHVSRPAATLGGAPSSSRIPAVGIDLGTTYSAIAVLDELGRPHSLVNSEGDKITPSVMLFDAAEVVVGKEAVKAMATDMERVAECPKRQLGQRMFPKMLGGRQYPPEALEAWVLNKLRRDAMRLIGDFDKVVITVPAYFDEVRRKATQDAGYIAGFDVIDIINEPTAAAVAFGFQQGFLTPGNDGGQRRNILVYDLGGGTFDVTVMEIGGTDFVTLATDGDMQLGGRDWDQRLVDHVAEEFIRKYSHDPREEPNSLGRLWRECEDVKHTLSARGKASISCDFMDRAVRIDVTRQTFQEITQDLLDRTAFTTRQTLSSAGLEWSDVDRVLMVGGSTRMPAVIEMMRELSGKEPDCSISPDEAVAHGAALHAGILLDTFQGKTPKFRIKNVNSHSLGVAARHSKTKLQRNAILIPRNTPLPATAKREFKTHKAGQKSIRVEIVEGESASPEDCSQIGDCSVRQLPPDLPRQTPIEVCFQYEENGRLNVAVNVKGMDEKLQHEITRENSMTQEQLDAWRKYISRLPPLGAQKSSQTPATAAGISR
jgi:molecular chaperone DnaK